MQFTTVIVSTLFALAAVAAPAPQADVPVLSTTDVDELAAVAKQNVDFARIDLDRDQCATACKGGVKVARAFCGRIPHIIAKGACYVAAAAASTEAGQNICIDFCDKTF